jgi:hypothetical protein
MDRPRHIGHFIAGIVLFSCLAMPANAISISVVGAVDNFLASARLSNSSMTTEESWVSGILGYAAKIDYRDNTTASAGWEFVNGSADHWAHSLTTDPAYYVLKLGVGNSGADTHYLYQNISVLSWAVIDLSELLAGQNFGFNFGRISHISEFDGTTTDLSEPGSLALLIIGFGLLGSVIAKKSRAA